MERLKNILGRFYLWLDEHAWGIPSILQQAFTRFNNVRANEAAASVAYYALFSLFPLLLFLIGVLGFVLAESQSPAKIVDQIVGTIPISKQLVQGNLVAIMEKRSTGGIIGLIGLGWAGSGVFMTIVRNINRAWPSANRRDFLKGRLLAVGMVGALTLLLALGQIITTILDLLPKLDITLMGSLAIYGTFAWRLFTGTVPWLFTLTVYILLYRLVPTAQVEWSHAFWGALAATIGVQIATRLFSWYLGSGFARYQILYGSLGTILALLTWIYLVAYITLFGAHLCSAVSKAKIASLEGSASKGS